jgi:LysR family transcriptional regulator, hydrogen peroxide-inducible genes activator
MELHQLRYFAAVAELGSFTQAAERCYVSQPSLSQQIIKLERSLGQPLLERLGRSVRLTPAGQAFYERAVRILRAVDEAQTCLEEATQTAGEITVGAILTVAPYLLPGIVREFRRQVPQSRLLLRENFTPNVLRDVLAGDVDIGFLALPVDDPRLVVEPILTEELLLALPVGHPLLKQKQLCMGDVANEPFVLLDEIHCLGEQIVSFCRRHACLPALSCKAAQLLTVQEMVAEGQGVSLIPEMAAKFAPHPRLVYRTLGEDAPRRTIALVRHRDRYHPPLVGDFREFVRDHTRQVAVARDTPPCKPRRKR